MKQEGGLRPVKKQIGIFPVLKSKDIQEGHISRVLRDEIAFRLPLASFRLRVTANLLALTLSFMTPDTHIGWTHRKELRPCQH